MANFQKLLSRKHTTLVDSILISAWNDQDRFQRLTGVPEYVRNLEVIDGDFYFDTEWMDLIISKYADHDPQFFLDFANRGHEHGEKLVASARAAQNSSENSLTIFKESIELIKNLLVFLPETHPLVKAIERKLVHIFKTRGLSEGQIQELLLTVSKPVKLNGPAIEIKELKEVKDEVSLQAHAKKFEYLGYREPFSKGYDLNFFRERQSSITKEKEEVPHPSDLNLNLTKDEQQYVGLMQEYVYFRNYRTEKLYEALYYLEPVWQKISVSLGLGDRGIFYYLEDEVEILLKSGTKVDPKVLKERERGYALLLHDGEVSILTGDELAAHKKLREGVVQNTDMIKGMIACKGVARGRARVILKASEQAKVEVGDILVTSMTTPDYLPAMGRAAAFVTDEGGITCHAAIVAREMKKPCIIGTKNATKIIQDGDLVEVDAERGVVTIVEKSK